MPKIPLLVPRMPTATQLFPYLQMIDANRKYTNFGPLNALLERRILQNVDVVSDESFVTTVGNCTVGIELALQANGLRPDSVVLLPSLTFVATATAIVRARLVPMFAEVDRRTWCLSPEIAAQAAREARVDAVVPVSTFGFAHDVHAWDSFSERTGIPVLIDAAGAFGNQGVGRTTDVVFSFHATKSFGAAEGGAVISADSGRIAQIRRLSNFGIDTERAVLVDAGTNGKMSEYHCAAGLASFDMWDETRRARVELHQRYKAEIEAGIPSIVFQSKPDEGIYPLLPVLLPEGVSAESVANAMALAGVETRRWYCPPLHVHPALRDFPKMSDTHVVDQLGDRILGLPYFLGITDEQIQHVIESLASTLSQPAL